MGEQAAKCKHKRFFFFSANLIGTRRIQLGDVRGCGCAEERLFKALSEGGKRKKPACVSICVCVFV